MKKDDGGYNYYVHYFDFNRRMDEWIEDNRIVSFPSVANPMETQYAHLHHGPGHKSDTAGPGTTETAQDGEKTLTTIAELEHDEHEGLDEAQLKEHEQITKVKNIQRVQLGKYCMECWYFSPFPKELFAKGFAECLYFCEYSLRFFGSKEELIHFQEKGFAQQSLPLHPPGHEIYRDDTLSMFELDGSIERIYCQNLCYFAKLFLDHKTLFWDVDAFLFYVLCTRDSRGFHPVGYFSKEKYSDLGYNLACILTFPCVQRQGYGRFLIEFSYELSKKEDKFGSPEKPLSDLGALGYKSYWAATLVRLLRDRIGSTGLEHVTIADLSCLTSIQPDDIIATLQYLGLLMTWREYAQKYQLAAGGDDAGVASLPQGADGEDGDADGQAPTMDVDEMDAEALRKAENDSGAGTEAAPKKVHDADIEGASSVLAAAPVETQKNKQPPQLRRHHLQKTAQKLKHKQQVNVVVPVAVQAPPVETTTVAADVPPQSDSGGAGDTSGNSGGSTGYPADESFVLLCDAAMLDELAKMYPEGHCRVQAHRLHWTPFYVMDPKKDKWSLYHLRQASQTNPLTCHVLTQLQQDTLAQAPQAQSQPLLPLASLTRSLSLSLMAGGGASSGAPLAGGAPTLSRHTTLLLGSSAVAATTSTLLSRAASTNNFSVPTASSGFADTITTQ